MIGRLAERTLTVESSPDGLQVNISRINPFNPIFFSQTDHAEAAKKAAAQFLKSTEKSGANGSGDFWGDISLSDLGEIFPLLFQLMNIDKGVYGLTTPISIEDQKSALPRWGKNLSIDRSIWADDADVEAKTNFIRLLSSLAVGPGELVWNELRKLCYLGPLRDVPPRNHEPERSPDEARWANGLAAWDILQNAEEGFISKVNQWLTHQNRLNAGYSVEVKKYKELDLGSNLMLALMQGRYNDESPELNRELLDLPTKRRLLLWEEEKNIEVLPQDVGVGISQVLPVIVAAIAAKTGFVVIEQPELHIHPAFQVALGDLFIEQIKEFPGLCFILETHSEHLMLRLLRRIRETSEQDIPTNLKLSPTELSICFIEQGKEGMSCQPIRVDEDGDFLDRWPRGFFNERAEELF